MDPLILALPAGLAVGASLGALGAGGSILTVPILVYLLGRSAHQATTMSLVVVGAAALAGAVAHARAGRVRVVPGLVFGLLGAAGSVLGSRAGARVDPNVLLLAFAGLMLAAAGGMLARSRRGSRRAGAELAAKGAAVISEAAAPTEKDPALTEKEPAPTEKDPAVARDGRASPRVTAKYMAKVVAAASAVGLLTGFFGVGGGFVVVPVLVLVFGYETATAIGTSLVVIAINSAVALTARLDAGQAALGGALLVAFLAAAVTGTLLGRRYAARMSPRVLSVAFSTLLVVLALYMGIRSLTGVL